MSILATKLRGADDLIEIARWIGDRTEPFEFMDITRDLGVTESAARRVCRDMEARGLLIRYRGQAVSRPTPAGGAQMWRLP